MTTIRIAATGETVEAPIGAVLLDVLEDAAIPVATECGGSGRCGLCAVRIVRGEALLRPPNRIEREAVGADGRLACQAEIVAEGEVEIDIPDPDAMLTRGLP